jgi:hypothetical protein
LDPVQRDVGEERDEENADQNEDQEERIESEAAKMPEELEDGRDSDDVPAVPSLAALLVCCDTASVLYG